MTTLLEKLEHVYINAPILLQPRIARVIVAVGTNNPNTVRSPILDKIEIRDSTLSLLEDNADAFLSLMRTLPQNHEMKRLLDMMSTDAEALQTKFEEAGNGLSELLRTDNEGMGGSSASALAQVANSLAAEASKLSEFVHLSKTLASLAGKEHKDEEDSPVEHDLPGTEEEGEVEPLPENPGGSIGAPADSSDLNDLFKS